MARKKYKTLLVIRLSAMGDVAMTIPILLSIQEKYPELKLVFLTKKHFKPIFSSLPNVIVHGVDVKAKHKGLWGVFKIYLNLKQYKIGAVADLHNVVRSKILTLLFRLKGSRVAQIQKGRKEKKALTLWKASKKIKPLQSTHARYAKVFDLLGYPINLGEGKFLLPKKGDSTNEILIGIAPFASFKGKMYPLPKVGSIIEQVLAQENCHIFLFGGGENEKNQLQKLADNFDSKVKNVAGVYSLEEELKLISNLNVMVSMDSGNGHLAANYGVPVLTIWGVTHPYLGFAPYNQTQENWLLPNRDEFPFVPTSVYGNKYPEGYEKAIETISPESISKRILELVRA